MPKSTLCLKEFEYRDLFTVAGLAQLDQRFLIQIQACNPTLHDKILLLRSQNTLTPIEISDIIIEAAKHLERFLAELFGIEEALSISQIQTIDNNPIAVFKKYYVLRRAKKDINRREQTQDFASLNTWLESALQTMPFTSKDLELNVALLGVHYLNDAEKYKAEIELLVQWCVQAILSNQELIKHWTSFHIPAKIDHNNLINTIAKSSDPFNRLAVNEEEIRLRDGFKLTDARINKRQVQDEVNYCIYCHDHDGDFCSKGFPVKKGDPSQGFKKNPLDLILTGCPLEEKISEMNFLKRDGHTLASLAVVMIDNPLCPATGHRICNDCMKACIYQKQEPVNIPQIETRVLVDVLALPWGVEIYDLLTRWNPLRPKQWLVKPYNGLKIMIAGMGPAGFTLAHHLLMEGFAVVGFDGLKIEPLPTKLIKEPIHSFTALKEELDARIMAGFGGVAEYGITVRWDKNFLKLIYLSLMRRPHFQVFGGVRFGGTITVEDAWDLGFQHFVIAVGAGLPRALPIPGSMAPGMRQANDFLMALQLGNAAKKNSLTNLQIRLPAVVIGGGLTGVDAATELQAYYIAQVEKLYHRYQILEKKYGEEHVYKHLDSHLHETLNEYLRHGKAIAAERKSAAENKTRPDFVKLIHAWGGVTIVYRRTMQESPAYINNHEELQKALQEGVFYLENLEPTYADLDQHQHVNVLVCNKRVRNQANEWITTTDEVRLPAKTILVATGTQPNIAYEFEHRDTFNRMNLQYQHYEDTPEGLVVARGIAHCKEPTFGPFTSYQKEDYRVTLVGDTHPVFHGNVVKAIASGMRTYPKITQHLQAQMQQGDEQEYQTFAENMRQLFTATIVNMQRLAPDIIEMRIQAPLAAKHFKPGQFYRLQNFETSALEVEQTLLQMEPLALVAADCDVEAGTLTFLIEETHVPAQLCATLQIGQQVSLMGPTGVRAKVPAERETVLIIGDKSSFAFLRSYGKELRAANNRVLYVGQFDKTRDVYCQNDLEQCADVIVWSSADQVMTARKRDYAFQGTSILSALLEYAEKSAQVQSIKLADVDRIYVVGNALLLKTLQASRQMLVKDHLLKNPKMFGSVRGHMQCMLKGVCAQCLQWQIDPETGQRTKAVFACSWQDQPLEIIDIEHMQTRSEQNRLLEQFSHLWLSHVFSEANLRRI